MVKVLKGCCDDEPAVYFYPDNKPDQRHAICCSQGKYCEEGYVEVYGRTFEEVSERWNKCKRSRNKKK